MKKLSTPAIAKCWERESQTAPPCLRGSAVSVVEGFANEAAPKHRARKCYPSHHFFPRRRLKAVKVRPGEGSRQSTSAMLPDTIGERPREEAPPSQRKAPPKRGKLNREAYASTSGLASVGEKKTGADAGLSCKGATCDLFE
jgi:hypothetical protein